MQASQSNKSKDIFSNIFSFYGGLVSFFGFEERRIDTIRRMILSRSDSDAIKEDFKKVGDDIRTSMKKHDANKEVTELYLCD
jgi:hypothetical protein